MEEVRIPGQAPWVRGVLVQDPVEPQSLGPVASLAVEDSSRVHQDRVDWVVVRIHGPAVGTVLGCIPDSCSWCWCGYRYGCTGNNDDSIVLDEAMVP